MSKLTKNYKLTRQNLQKGGVLLCPSDLTSDEPNSKALKEFVSALATASTLEEVTSVFDKLKERKAELNQVIIAMPNEFCKLAGAKEEKLKALLGDDGKVSNLLTDTVDLGVFVGSSASTVGVEESKGDDDTGPAGAGTGALAGGARRKRSSKKSSKKSSKTKKQ